MTCFASIIDLNTRTITFANAGHDFPAALRACAPPPWEAPLLAQGRRPAGPHVAKRQPAGRCPRAHAQRAQPVAQPGDSLVWYTDGVVECESPAGEEFGDKRFRAAISSATGSSRRQQRPRNGLRLGGFRTKGAPGSYSIL